MEKKTEGETTAVILDVTAQRSPAEIFDLENEGLHGTWGPLCSLQPRHDWSRVHHVVNFPDSVTDHTSHIGRLYRYDGDSYQLIQGTVSPNP